MQPPDGSQSGHGHSNSGSTVAGFTPPTPGRISDGYGYGYIPPHDTAAGPFYRPPRTRRVEGVAEQLDHHHHHHQQQQQQQQQQYSSTRQSRASWASDPWAQGRSSQGSLPAHILATQGGDDATPGDAEWDPGRGTPTGAAASGGGTGHRHTDSAVTVGSNRGNTDYAVREGDFYYGVRGPALSYQPQRRLGTGPADPTGPVSTAKGWLKQKLGLARGEKEKGFSVVRSARNPDAILDAQRDVAQQQQQQQQRAGAAGADNSAEATGDGGSIGMAMTTGDEPEPIQQHDSTTGSESDYSDADEPEPTSRMLEKRPEGSSMAAVGVSGGSHTEAAKPQVPRKSSKRRSRDVLDRTLRPLYDPPIPRGGSTGRLPFEEPEEPEDGDGDDNESGAGGHRRRKDEHSLSFSTTSSGLEPPQLILDDGRPGSGESRGEVSYGRVSAVMRNEQGDIRGSQAELVRGGTGSSRNSRSSNASSQRRL